MNGTEDLLIHNGTIQNWSRKPGVEKTIPMFPLINGLTITELRIFGRHHAAMLYMCRKNDHLRNPCDNYFKFSQITQMYTDTTTFFTKTLNTLQGRLFLSLINSTCCDGCSD